MKIRIKFAKYGTMKFIGHLDVMRFFQKVFRRANVDIAFSEGMSPHMILSFAAPLGLGAEGMSEYADIQINASVPGASAAALPQEYVQDVLGRMNSVSVEGIEFLDFRPIPDGKASKAMSLVTAADYAVRVRPGHEPKPVPVQETSGMQADLQADLHGESAAGEEVHPSMVPSTLQEWQQLWDRFLAQPSITILKETKKGTKEADIRPMILEISLGKPFEASMCAAQKDLEIHPAGENDQNRSMENLADESGYPVIYMRLATGSAANLKPEQVIEAFYAFAGFENDPFAVTVTRLDLYASKEDGSLCSLGKL